jgi:invasion protein IalB
MTGARLSQVVAACVALASFAGVVAASAQQVLSPDSMIDHPFIQSKPPAIAPAPISPRAEASAAPSQAAAGEAAGKPDLTEEIGDWRLQCFSKPARACRLSQRQVTKQDHSLLIWAELTHFITPKEKWLFVVMLPLGLKVAPVLDVRAGGELFLNMPIVTCVPAGCVYSADVPAAGLETLRKSQTLATEVADLKGHKYPINVSMHGFTQAYLKSAIVVTQK